MNISKINKLAIAACLGIFLASCATEAPEAPPEETSASPTTEETTTPASPSELQATASGNFVEAEHPTAGIATIVNEDGKNYLQFDDNFKSDDGPDLFVLLHKSEVPETYKEEDYVSLGELQSTNGSQRYEIPDSVNLADYQSTVIWCRKFDATFGYATLASEPAE
ncbi:MAG: DM13 domain-containing protein [Spirulinaceae cyanobacterium]